MQPPPTAGGEGYSSSEFATGGSDSDEGHQFLLYLPLEEIVICLSACSRIMFSVPLTPSEFPFPPSQANQQPHEVPAVPENQHPKPGCEWYQPTTISGLTHEAYSRQLFMKRVQPTFLSA